jgi:hypothetical protein
VAPTLAPTPRPTPKPTPRPTPRPTSNTNPAFKALSIPKTEDCTGDSAGTIHISWTVANATGVTLAIDGPGLFDTYPGRSGAVDVPFACSHQEVSHTYAVTTTGGSGPAARITRTVTATKPQITTFRLGTPACQPGDPSVAIFFQYQVVAATGVELDRDGSTYGTYSGKTSTNGLSVVYDCTKDQQTFVLRTTGGYGPEATKTIVRKKP